MTACERCGGGFAARRASARYCSARCRQAAWRDRQTADGAPDDADDPDEGEEAAAVDRALRAVAGDDVAVLVVDAVQESPRAGLVALAGWLAETVDGLDPAARVEHGPRFANALAGVLKVLARPAAAVDRPTSRLDQLRAARAAQTAAGHNG